MSEQAFNYVEGVIGGNSAANASDTSWDGDITSYATSAGKANKLTFWALEPQQLEHEIQAACAGAKGRS